LGAELGAGTASRRARLRGTAAALAHAGAGTGAEVGAGSGSGRGGAVRDGGGDLAAAGCLCRDSAAGIWTRKTPSPARPRGARVRRFRVYKEAPGLFARAPV